MIISVDCGRVCNPNVVGFSFIPFGRKGEIRSLEAGDKSSLWGRSVGERECAWESDWRNPVGRVLSPKSKNPPCGVGEECVGVSLAGGGAGADRSSR
ncbi:hypothetical protein AVEN_213802-1 [Araneus ventricosus]|uniref:Uncharacterized protein n=1 Tax=Araneus ventricosus TaxID=182803 RepID=A0A4Y2VH66_ARAVE|nr:hypothetical protein AVEN_213802-1 [Araneus ventricosus]